MKTIAVVGAGPRLGSSIASRFGREGHPVALISRNQSKLDELATRLTELGIQAGGFAADVADAESLTAALDRAVRSLGPIGVLEFSPYPGLARVSPIEVTVDNLKPQIELLLYGAVTAVDAVLPQMLESGTGTLLFTSGGGSVNPFPMIATMNAAQAATRNWALNLHNVLKDKGVYVGHVAISTMIGTEAPEGVPCASPDEIAEVYWDMHTKRDQAEYLFCR